MKKRYYWEIRTDGRSFNYGEALEARPLWRRGRKAHIFLLDVTMLVGGPLPARPYRVSYLHPNICEARKQPDRYGRRAYRCKVI